VADHGQFFGGPGHVLSRLSDARHAVAQGSEQLIQTLGHSIHRVGAGDGQLLRQIASGGGADDFEHPVDFGLQHMALFFFSLAGRFLVLVRFLGNAFVAEFFRDDFPSDHWSHVSAVGIVDGTEVQLARFAAQRNDRPMRQTGWINYNPLQVILLRTEQIDWLADQSGDRNRQMPLQSAQRAFHGGIHVAQPQVAIGDHDVGGGALNHGKRSSGLFAILHQFCPIDFFGLQGRADVAQCLVDRLRRTTQFVVGGDGHLAGEIAPG